MVASGRRRLDLEKLDAWLKEIGADRLWLATALLTRMERSVHRRKSHATMASSVQAEINRWASKGLSRMYQSLLSEVTDRLSVNWYLDQPNARVNENISTQPSVSPVNRTTEPNAFGGPKSADASPASANAASPAIERDDDRYELRSAHLLDQFFADFKAASAFYTTGTNLRRIVANRYLDHVSDLLGRGGIVKALMHHPKSKVCEYAMIQDIGISVSRCDPNRSRRSARSMWNIDEYRRLVHNNLSALCELREQTENGANLKIRTTNYMLSFGLDAFFFDKGHKKGALYVRFYPLPRRNADNPDKPCIRFDHGEPTWFDFFKDQFDLHWAPPTRGGLAQDVSPHYPWRLSWEDVRKKLKVPNGDLVFW